MRNGTATLVPGAPRLTSEATEDGPVAAATRRRMQCVRSKNSGPEIAVRQALHAAGFGFRLHRRDLPGTPDIVMSARQIAIFVHGCFWHRHPNCSRATIPKTRVQFWMKKFERTVQRDMKVRSALQERGWRVLEVWECEIYSRNFPLRLLSQVEQYSVEMREHKKAWPAYIGSGTDEK